MAARGAWCLAVALVLALLAASLPTYAAHLQSVCLHEPCAYLQLTPRSVRVLHAQGVSIAWYVWCTLAITLGTALVWIAMGALLAWRRSDDWMALLVAFMLIVVGAGNGLNIGTTLSETGWEAPANLLSFLNGLAIVVVFCLFPGGRFAPRWLGWVMLSFVLVSFPHEFFAAWEAHLPNVVKFLGFCVFIGSLLLVAGAQVYRYWYVSTALQRQQTKWILFCLAMGIASIVGWEILLVIFPSLDGSLYGVVNAYVGDVCSLLFPISFAIAILRYRLWDIDILINRTLVYGALTMSVVGVYVLVVGYLGALFRTGGNLLISLLATGCVAVLFQPLRGWLQRGVNRLMYGQRDEPYAVVAQLGRRLESTLEPEAVLPTIVETVAEALKLPYAAVTLRQGDGFVSVATYGASVEGVLALPLIYQSEPIGQLLLGPRQRGDTFTPADRRLLNDLARQVGVAAHAVRLTGDLQRSREQLVTAREEERRRLRRDLHDGLGPTLAALALKATTVSDLIMTDPAAAAQLSDTLYSDIRATVGEIRRLVYALRPPRLDELGLIGALYEACEAARQQSHPGGPLITVEAPEKLLPLSAAVEVAAYRITQEALTNVIRHAQASVCVVRLAFDGALQVEITDDGVGIPPDHHAGVGLLSMRERAAEVGGTCVIGDAGSGMRVCARLPILAQ